MASVAQIRTFFYLVTLRASPRGGWERVPVDLEPGYGCADLDAALAGFEPLYELGTSPLPSRFQDIRGRVDDEPERLFATQTPDGRPAYFGIEGRAVWCDAESGEPRVFDNSKADEELKQLGYKRLEH